MKTFEKLKERIKKDLDIDADCFHRNYPGYWQSRSGAWQWVATRLDEVGNNSYKDIGSCIPATTLLKSKGKLEIIKSGEIFPAA